MVDDNVFTELNFEVTGGGLSDLQRLATLLGVVDKVAGDLTQNLSASSKGFNAQARAIRNAAKAYESYVAAQSKASTVATGGAVAGAGGVAGPQTTGAVSGDAALRIQEISNQRALALESANNVTLEH